VRGIRALHPSEDEDAQKQQQDHEFIYVIHCRAATAPHHTNQWVSVIVADVRDRCRDALRTLAGPVTIASPL
jgi:hypothetical protein